MTVVERTCWLPNTTEAIACQSVALRRRGSVDGSGNLLRGVSSIGSGLLRGLSTDCGTPVIEDIDEEDTV